MAAKSNKVKSGFENKKVLILGEGASGVSAYEFLKRRGAEVVIYDDKNADSKAPRAKDFDLCVISPGVSINHRIAKKFEGRIISELALGFTAPHKKIVAVTGTNGKTTTVNMIHNSLGAKRSTLCGNVGTPVTAVEDDLRKKIAVVEVSSFMLEVPHAFRPNIACILNVSQDHLERHKTIEEYVNCKTAIAKNQTAKDILILNHDDETCRNIAAKIKEERGAHAPKILFFSTQTPVRGIYLSDKDIILNTKKRPKIIFKIEEFNEGKPHQIQNILAAVLVAKLLGARRESILTACRGTNSLEHRIQHIGTAGHAAFYNDSKATNVASTLAACKCFHTPLELLLGGQAKGQNFDELFANLPRTVEHIFCFGTSASEILQSAKRASFTNIEQCADMQDATTRAYNIGSGPRTILLSPACASFDQFDGYADRGRKFVESVNEIIVSANEVKTEAQESL